MTMVDFEVRWGELVWRVLDPRDRRLAREGCWYAEAPETARRIVAVESFMANNSAGAIMDLSLKVFAMVFIHHEVVCRWIGEPALFNHEEDERRSENFDECALVGRIRHYSTHSTQPRSFLFLVTIATPAWRWMGSSSFKMRGAGTYLRYICTSLHRYGSQHDTP